MSREHCGKRSDEHCNKIVGKYYMGGSVELMSADLASHIASLPNERRLELEVTIHEDITIRNFVLSHPGKVTMVELGKPLGAKLRTKHRQLPVLWSHRKFTKVPGRWIVAWVQSK